MNSRIALCALAVFLLLGGCSAAPKSTDVAVTAVTVSPPSVSLVAGTTQSLTATVAPSNATHATVTWSSSAPAIATVSSEGLVTAVSAGDATVTATSADGAFTGSCAVTVTAAVVAVTGLTVSPTSASIAATLTQQLTATVTPANATDPSVSWTSSNPAIATVDTHGLVTAVLPGTATIGVKTVSGNFAAEVQLTVTPPLEIAESTASLFVAGTQQLTTTNATPHPLTWATSDATVVTVSDAGVITGVGLGSAIVSASVVGFTTTTQVEVVTHGTLSTLWSGPGPLDTPAYSASTGKLYVHAATGTSLTEVDPLTGAGMPFAITDSTSSTSAPLALTSFHCAAAGDALYLADTFPFMSGQRTRVWKVPTTTRLASVFIDVGLVTAPLSLSADGTWVWVDDPSAQAVWQVEAANASNAVSFANGAAPGAYVSDRSRLFIASPSHDVIRKNSLIDSTSSSLSDWVGQADTVGTTDATGTSARLSAPTGLVTVGGALYVTDQGNQSIRRVAIASGAVTTAKASAGTALGGMTTDGTALYFVDGSTLMKLE
jgi:uncharacterized protein YjdB